MIFLNKSSQTRVVILRCCAKLCVKLSFCGCFCCETNELLFTNLIKSVFFYILTSGVAKFYVSMFRYC
jgi:hypothetical protein